MHRCRAFIIACLLALGLNANNYDEETFLVLKTLVLDNANPAKSISNYKNLYEITKNPEYLKEAIKTAYVFKHKDLDELIKIGDSVLMQNNSFLKVKSAYLSDLGKKDEALNTAKKLIEVDPSATNYSVLGLIQSDLGFYDDALKNLTKAYEIDDSDVNLIRIADLILSKKGDVNGAISKLENYRLSKGCSVEICSVLLDIYKQTKNFPMVLAIDEELFKVTQDNKYMDEILGYYIYEKDYKSLIRLLEQYSYNDKLLIEIYAFTKEYDKAISLANKSFNDTNDKEFIALKAMMTYEKNMPNVSDEIAREVASEFESSVDESSKSVYQNYYGYLLIDHNIDPKRGIELVEYALKEDLNSPYYLDSLAWGYYKINKCELAKKTIDSIDKSYIDYFDSKEAKEHIEMIDKCLKGAK